MSMPTITHDDNKTYTLPTIFLNIEQESESKSRVRALTRDPSRAGPKLLTWRPGSICGAVFASLRALYFI